MKRYFVSSLLLLAWAVGQVAAAGTGEPINLRRWRVERELQNFVGNVYSKPSSIFSSGQTGSIVFEPKDGTLSFWLLEDDIVHSVFSASVETLGVAPEDRVDSAQYFSEISSNRIVAIHTRSGPRRRHFWQRHMEEKYEYMTEVFIQNGKLILRKETDYYLRKSDSSEPFKLIQRIPADFTVYSIQPNQTLSLEALWEIAQSRPKMMFKIENGDLVPIIEPKTLLLSPPCAKILHFPTRSAK